MTWQNKVLKIFYNLTLMKAKKKQLNKKEKLLGLVKFLTNMAL